jgi:hypothetical protein
MKCVTCKVSFAQHELRPYPPIEGESECIGCLYKRVKATDVSVGKARFTILLLLYVIVMFHEPVDNLIVACVLLAYLVAELAPTFKQKPTKGN